MSILITGGAGFIGSHTCVEMLNSGYDVVVVDNLDNSSSESLDRVEKITGKKVKFYKEDVRNREALRKIFTENSIEAVIHFAGLKAVGESVREPIMYYDNNLINTLVLLETMNEFGVKKIVFSSSATVYGVATEMPLVEGMPLGAINPYGRTKLFIEHILTDIYAADKDWCVALLRYFNPIGAHKATGVDVPYVIDPRRPGDPDEVYANADKAKKVLGWTAKYGIEEMCEDTWRWQKNNPNGFEK